ncbi:hypothetical protein ABZ896_42345 [Streptomyces sp. NPDC047072]|uniref:hypothetical protein n=1 Tax=Streptomyces sp. NPDC047072 TaxID=3154809 RepID=UPI00340355CA
MFTRGHLVGGADDHVVVLVMTSWRTRLRLAVPTTVTASLLALTGALTPASAAGATWEYVNGWEGECLRATTGGDPVVGSCSGTSHLWHWGTESNTWNGHTMRRLVNNASGDCVTSNYGSGSISVSMAPCGGGRSGQFWTADNGYLQNQNHAYLGTYSDGGLFTADLGDGAPSDTYFFWSGYIV